MKNWFKNLSQGWQSPRSETTPSFRPRLEPLEDRLVLDGGVLHSNLVPALLTGTTSTHVPHPAATPTPTISSHAPVLPNLSRAQVQTVSTVAANGDQNPYGVAFVPQGFAGKGMLQPGDVLVSNFNDSNDAGNVQGTGSTIVRITPTGQQSTFFQGPPGLGLTTALGVLKSGFVIVGSVPNTANGVQQGSLLIIDSNGNQVGQISDSALLDGPWDLAINDQGTRAQVFVSNVLSGTVTRINLEIPPGSMPLVESETQIASGYAHRSDPNALVVGPTGLAFDPRTGVLYVASTADNEIFAIPNAARTQRDHGMGRLVVRDNTHLHGPLGLVIAPNGDLIVSNGDAVNADPNHLNELVEFTPSGRFVSQFQIDTGTAGAAFGIALSTDNGQLRFAAVDDNTNTLTTWTFTLSRHHDFDSW
jgi:DNA-binding beta-propeller fold protein YncE